MRTSLVSKQRRRVPKLSLQRLYRIRTVGAGRWSPDGRWICFASNASGRQNLWVVPANGGWPLQLTVSEERQIPGGWSPDGRWIVYQSDYGGNEQWDLFAVSLENGEIRELTCTPEISEEAPRWSPDRRWIAYEVKPRTSASYEIHLMEFATGRVREITAGTAPQYSNHSPLWSPDGQRLAYTRVRSDQEVDVIYVADLRTGESRRVSPEVEANFHATAWSPDGRRLLISSNALNRFSNIGLLDVESPSIQWITRGRWESEAGDWSGRWITYESNVDGNSEVYLYDTIARRRTRVRAGTGINGLGSEVFSRDGRRLLLNFSGPAQPNDLYTLRMGAKNLLRVTNSLLAAMEPRDMVEPYLVHYRSFDGLKISAFLYIPYNLKRNRSNPAIVSVHGGPSAQSMNGFDRATQYLVNSGYIVIAPNYRGSTGYGKDFEEKNRFDMGGGDLQDVVRAAKFLETTGYVDRRRIALTGASYGGYLTMMGLTKTPEVWAAGVARVPFVNWFTELEHEDPALREWDIATMGDPVANRALYEERSPINFIDRIRAPLLVLAGANDPRCPRGEAEQIVAAVRARGGVVECKIYEDEGHSLARIENAVDSFERMVAFLDRHMRPSSC